jgi:SAM-dependent methyltransferase
VEGIEPNAAAGEQAGRRLDRVFARNVEDPGAFDGLGPYDALLFLDVLEHLVNPWHALTTATRVLRPGGVVHVVVPNVAHVSVVRRLLSGRFEYADIGTMDRTHLRWFTRSSLKTCLEQAGLERTDVSVIPIVPRLDAERAWSAPLAETLGKLMPDAFGGSLHGRGFARVHA